MATLIDTLTASGGTESAGFLNDIVKQLWPNISVAGAQILKDVVEPILASTLPGPLANLRFVKLDFGNIPIQFDHVDVHKTTNQGIKLDMDVNWAGVCDIELDGSSVPKIGIEKVGLKGRLSILLCPLTNVLPLISATQIAFINPPDLKLDFTDAANIADFFLIDSTVRKTILGIIESMLVLPQRYLVKLDSNNDYFKAYQPHLGIVRVTIRKATGIVASKKKSGASRLLAKIIKDVPDCFVKVKVGAEDEWRTSVQKNNTEPEWNESHDFLVADYEQGIFLEIQDDDLVGDDDIGLAYTTIKDILLDGGTHELALKHEGEPTEGRLAVQAKFYGVTTNAQQFSASSSDGSGNDRICGLVTVLIASALNLNGDRDSLNPSVQVVWGDKKFVTVAKSYTPGTDIYNPAFDQAWRVPVTADMFPNLGTIRLSLMNKKDEVGGVDVALQDILSAPNMLREENFDVGSGAVIRASIALHGLKAAE